MSEMHGWNRTGLDADREEAIASGMVEPTAEEQLERDWEAEDALASKAVELGITGPWTAFSPAECRVIATALEVAQVASSVVGLAFDGEDAVMVDGLRLKAEAGAKR